MKRLGVVTFVTFLAATALPSLSRAATPTCFGRPATIVGTNHSETIYGTAGDDVIVARRGNDIIRRGVDGYGGNDYVCAGRGRDRVHMDGLLYGGRGRDRLIAGPVEFDFLGGGPGDDYLHGGRGESFGDYAFYRNAKNAVTVNLEKGIAKGEGTDTLVRIESVEGSPFNDTLIGNISAVDAFGGDGNDIIRRGFGHIVRGGDGNDAIRIFLAELIDGNAGNDWIHTLDPDDLSGGEGDDTVVGTRFPDGLFLEDDPGNDIVRGRRGDDRLSVEGGGTDEVFGGLGVDECLADAEDTQTACEV